MRERDRDLKRVLLLLSGLLILKIIALRYFAGFSVDLGTFEAWALKIATEGPARAYQQGYFLDYPPGYLYRCGRPARLPTRSAQAEATPSSLSSRCRR